MEVEIGQIWDTPTNKNYYVLEIMGYNSEFNEWECKLLDSQSSMYVKGYEFTIHEENLILGYKLCKKRNTPLWKVMNG